MNNLPPTISSRVLLGVAAGAAVGLAVPGASAAVVTFDPANVTIGAGGSGTGTVYFDPRTGYVGGTQDEGNGVETEFGLGYNINAAKPVLLGLDNTQAGANYSGEGLFANGYAIRAGTSAAIDSTAGSISGTGGFLYLNSNNDSNSQWPAGSHGFLGLVITNDPNGGAAAANFGWAEVSYNTDESLTLYRFGYETDLNTTITTPATLAPGDAVPEPGSLAAVASLGAAGLLAYRRRQRTRAGVASMASGASA
ncbi:MAG: PEP-CTERM sorting domain-containing protein [Rhodospirillales bacterium]|nr:PEP-CTERM sorting domain-containing protein [Acetobacter sp.]